MLEELRVIFKAEGHPRKFEELTLPKLRKELQAILGIVQYYARKESKECTLRSRNRTNLKAIHLGNLPGMGEENALEHDEVLLPSLTLRMLSTHHPVESGIDRIMIFFMRVSLKFGTNVYDSLELLKRTFQTTCGKVSDDSAWEGCNHDGHLLIVSCYSVQSKNSLGSSKLRFYIITVPVEACRTSLSTRIDVSEVSFVPMVDIA
ncbi:unnamed protein product [Lepeophtheirus salmonis]|uniref:(salmon louse) hypothetical protein n=1 Tax=Lepeophtheirus salmonis TaxID=72036 RepID=A0A7R8CTH5_LEPSM|nr:unnamed protein product [Lepeophtheirus salmonis]CAF2924564.1 unnamed protein product [Lepeophtheirus salmonis]